MVLTRTLYGEEAAKRPDLLPEQDKERIRTLSSAVAAVVGGVAGSRDGGGNAVDVLADAQVGGVVGRNAVENNHLSALGQMQQFAVELERACGSQGSPEQCAKVYNDWRALSYRQGGLAPNDTGWEEFVLERYQEHVFPLCKGNNLCERRVAQSMQINLVLSAGDAAGLRDLVERDRRAANIVNGNWVRVGLDTVGDLGSILAIRGMVNPASSYSRFLNSVFTKPSSGGFHGARNIRGSVGIIGSNSPVTLPHNINYNVLKQALDRATPTAGHPNQLMYTLTDGTRVIFRKDFGANAHPIRNIFPGKGSIDHYNIEVQIPKARGGVRVIENLHIVPNSSGGFTWWGKDGVIRK